MRKDFKSFGNKAGEGNSTVLERSEILSIVGKDERRPYQMQMLSNVNVKAAYLTLLIGIFIAGSCFFVEILYSFCKK